MTDAPIGQQNSSPRDDNQAMLDTPVSHESRETKNSPLDASSKLLVEDKGTSYIDGAHWSAILEEVSSLCLSSSLGLVLSNLMTDQWC